jgi:glycosyltransferase involved in cell wall biosynthesis
MARGRGGEVMAQGEILAGYFGEAGYPVHVTSTLPGRYERLLDALRSLYRWRHDLDVVNVMVFSGPSFAFTDAVSQLGRRLGLPVVLHLRGGNLPTFAAKHPRWVRRVLRRADAIVAPSPYLQRCVVDLGFAADVIPNLIPVEDFPWKQRTRVAPRLLWMRSFHPLYNPEMAVHVLDLVRRTHPHAQLTMAGPDKGNLDAVRALVRARGLDAHVRFPGFLDREGKLVEFERHDVFLNTNRIDNTPVSVLEAAAFGLPVVATDVGGITDLLVGGDTAILVPDDDAGAMAAAVLNLVEQPELATRLSMNGRFAVERCSWASVRAGWEEIYRRLVPVAAVPR